MEPTSIISAALSTLLGKVAAGTVVAAASVGGLHAADVVDLPVGDDASDVVTIDTPADPDEVVGLTPAAGKADPQDEADETEAEETEEADAEETEAEETEAEEAEEADGEGAGSGEPNANADFGQSVAADARDGGVDGQDVASQARAGTPAADRVPADRGAPADAGERRDADVRQDDEAEVEDDDEVVAEEQAPADAGSQAGEHRPESAGPAAAANGRP